MAKRRYFNRFTEKENRRELRGADVPAEKKLWSRLRDRQMYGHKFRRQVSVGSFVVDFYCPSLKLAIELDGESHYCSPDAQEADQRRQAFIEALGVRFLRFTNPQIHDELDAVVEAIGNTIIGLDRTRPPSLREVFPDRRKAKGENTPP
jgi:very-short-patch-repair endonuclease